MEDSINELDLMQENLLQTLKSLSQGETFDFTLPFGWRWFGFFIGLILMLYGAIQLFINFLIGSGAIIIGSIILGFSAPSKILKVTNQVRIIARPNEVKIATDRGGVKRQNFWNNEVITIPKSDNRAWVLPAPKKEDWDPENPYGEDKNGIISEHPKNIGTPTPATFSWFGLTMLLSSSFLAIGWILTIHSSKSSNQVSILTTAIVFIICLCIILLSRSSLKKTQLSLDTPTSMIRSMAIGPLELVGQVRPWIKYPEPVIIDDDKSKQVDDLVAWKWTYEVEVEWEEKSKDSEGNITTKTRRTWKNVRSKKGNHNFILNDGTGGVKVLSESFHEQELGQWLTEWRCRHDTRVSKIFRNVMMKMDNKRVIQHRWRIYGLKIGDPTYILGFATSRDNKSIEQENLDITVAHHLLEIKGEGDHTGFSARLERGSELTMLSNAKSTVDGMIGPLILLLGSAIGLLMTL